MALALLCRTPTGLACVVSWHGLLPQIERLCARERLQGGSGGPGGSGGDQYMTAVVAGLTQQMAANVVPLLHQAAAAARAAPPAHGGGGDGSGSAALPPLEALLLLLGSVAFRPMVVCDGLITGLADMLAWEVGGGGAAAGTSPQPEVKVSCSRAPRSAASPLLACAFLILKRRVGGAPALATLHTLG